MPALDQIESLLAIIGSVGAFFIFLGTLVWRLSTKVHTLTMMAPEIVKLRSQIAHTGKLTREAVDVVAQRVGALEQGLAGHAAILAEREKSTLKLEGKMEQAHDDMLKVVSSLTQVMGSVDALWRTLERIHPDQIPRRASQKRGV